MMRVVMVLNSRLMCWWIVAMVFAIFFVFPGWNLWNSSPNSTQNDLQLLEDNLHPLQPSLQIYKPSTTKRKLNLHPELKITQTSSIKTRTLTCVALIHVDNVTLYHIDLRWDGKGLQQSLWVKQPNATQEKGCIARQLKFDPSLETNAGAYTCNLIIKDNDGSIFKMNKTVLVKAEYHGLISSRMVTQKFDLSPVKPNKWFPNGNLCGKVNAWQNYADFHAAVLSGKQRQKYLVYDCAGDYGCGGYGNRLYGITLLLLLAMLTNHAFLLKITNPDDINLYLQPNAIQWNYTSPDLEKLKRRRLYLFNKSFIKGFKKLEAAVRSDDDYDVMTVRINYGVFSGLNKMSEFMFKNTTYTFELKTQYDCILLYGCAFNYLFKYQPKVIQGIEALETELGLEAGKYVALHIRSFIKDGTIFNPLHLDFPYKPMFECAVMTAKSLSNKLNVSKVPIFLATDHPSIKAYAKENYKDVFTLSRAPKFHVDRQRKKGATTINIGMMGVLSDVEICSRAAVLIRSAVSTLSEIMGAIHFYRPQYNLHPYYFYENISMCHV